ncbi:MAG: hypothetical protein CMF22_10070 [Idiomarinaceae bacterium]|nr:hypothetical protein [Idiomarinaceae bacterium]MBG23787.1 hypothetical protein [Idiomarinaceae bacterium]|tara:strand:+ start:54551 stop:55543 length:993 start_codon:yes stop_codon:yes gene_type:complete
MQISESNVSNVTSNVIGPITSEEETIRLYVWGDFGSGNVKVQVRMPNEQWVSYPELTFTTTGSFGIQLFPGSTARIVVENATDISFMCFVKSLYDDLAVVTRKNPEGFAYIPKPYVLGQQNLYQDAAATIPVTMDNQPVGFMRDISPNGNHATQPDNSRRPIYRRVNGRDYLQFPVGGTARMNIPPNAITGSTATYILGFTEQGTDNSILLGAQDANTSFLFVSLEGSSSTTINANATYEDLRVKDGGSMVPVFAVPTTRDGNWSVLENHNKITFQRLQLSGTFITNGAYLLGYDSDGWEAEGEFHGAIYIEENLRGDDLTLAESLIITP